MDLNVIFNVIHTEIKENVKIIEEKHMVTTEERILHKQWINPKIKEEKRRTCPWVPPMEHWLKINFNGALKGNPSEAGGGSIYRDAKGNLIWAFGEHYNQQMNHYAEMDAILKVMDLALKGATGLFLLRNIDLQV